MSKHFLSKAAFFEAMAEQPDIWQTLSNIQKPIILYGMGDGADKILRQFEKYNININGVMASDGFVRGQDFHGFRVCSLAQIEETWNDFIIVLAFGTQLRNVMDNIEYIAEKHSLFVPYVPVYGDEIFNHDFFLAHRFELEQVYDLLADETSLRVFQGEIEFYLTGNLQTLISLYSDKSEAFDSILKLSNREDYLDLGAYRGDTIRELIQYAGGYRTVMALEPDTKTFAKLQANTVDLANILLFNKSVWKEDTTLLFDNRAGRNSSLSGKMGKPVEAIAVDTLFKNKNLSYLKADVEGAEYEMLEGAGKTLQRCKPKLNIAVYHRGGDLFRLPLLLHSLVPEYRIYLRQHPYIPAWDLNMYAVANTLQTNA